ncbi:YjgP/YjgQ family permease [Roseivivax marinus]|jgi:lipopolysaccharide export system permease protein|uniref:YjgP/YjgQ family permease n=1 Tax=Roseivivax marinus TaxID=1379903 RepID=W4HR37_9RHOB|nr:LPS export ABC transporter permease LptG [Roseivivax marinus]ETW14455.1 YjgP/YjgQ family permease [Roseivivax marinus]UMA66312.1 LPS export ABC transporter permease LptG [Roseivivax marinus]SEL35651.1 lipopolysaccharide export system permease protein [Roseivivax marinus]
MTLHLYFARRFLMMFLGLFAVFALFLGLLDLVEQLRRFDGEVAFGNVVTLTLLNAPSSLYEMLPLIMILASVAVFLSLARSSELVVARASGRSGLVALVGPVMVAALTGCISVAVLNPIAAATSQRFETLSERYSNGETDTLSIGEDGLWLRQGDRTGQTVIRATRANADATTLFDVTFVTYDADVGPVRRVEAESATLGDGAWTLTNAKSWPLAPGQNAEALSETFDELRIESTLTRENIRDRFGRPSAVPIWALPGYIADLERAGFSAQRHIVWFWMELARPLFLVALVMLGAGFTMRHSRLGRTGLSVLTAVLLGFGLYYVRNFAQILGETGQIPAIPAAWVPPVASLLLALGLILQREDG